MSLRRNPKISEGLRQAWKNPNSGFHSENRKRKLSRATKDQVSDPIFKRRFSETIKEKWLDPNSKYNSLEYREGLKEAGKIRKPREIENPGNIYCNYGCGQ